MSSITSIHNKRCTAVLRNQEVNGGGASTTSTSPITSADLATPTPTAASSSTTLSTPPASISTPASLFTSPPNVINTDLPALDTPISSTEETSSNHVPGPTDQPSDNLISTPPPNAPGASSPTSNVVGGTATTTTTGSGQLESSEAGAGLANGTHNVTGNVINTQTTVAIAGGVIGGLVLLSIVTFLMWFVRKRLIKKRRSTLLTPLSTGPASGGDEKGPYMSRNSLGPATLSGKVRAMVGSNYHRLRGRVNSLVTRSPNPSTGRDRDSPQFGLSSTPVTRSGTGIGASTAAVITKDRFVDWWGRLFEDGNFNWKLQNDPGSEHPDDTSRDLSKTPQPREIGSQPNFLALLSMDEQQQQQSFGGNIVTTGSNNSRRSQSLGNDHFLGGLGLNFDAEDPFADSNAMTHDSAKVMPLSVSGPGPQNPFSDANALSTPARPVSNNHSRASGPITYVQNIRRSRGYSASAATTRLPSRASARRTPSLYRESGVSVETSDTRRNKFRSDPFDLDGPELLSQAPGSNPQGLPNMPQPAQVRRQSFTSRYSSGVSTMGDWSDPGPDVGPAAGRWDTPSPDSTRGAVYEKGIMYRRIDIDHDRNLGADIGQTYIPYISVAWRILRLSKNIAAAEIKQKKYECKIH
ncbi:hypothetical protein F4777DRAFT_596166 [Nemania sp. FL0916]|nr:hypothetical protein F4777DRAFT_596166 [Nemania sp. FL0916]